MNAMWRKGRVVVTSSSRAVMMSQAQTQENQGFSLDPNTDYQAEQVYFMSLLIIKQKVEQAYGEKQVSSPTQGKQFQKGEQAKNLGCLTKMNPQNTNETR